VISRREGQDNTTQKGEDNHPFLKGIRTDDLSIKAIKAYASNRAATWTG
jgi:hypothetical protein